MIKLLNSVHQTHMFSVQSNASISREDDNREKQFNVQRTHNFVVQIIIIDTTVVVVSYTIKW